MSKLGFFFMTLVGAIPAGGALYALIRNLLDRADSLGTVLLAITITATVCTALVVLTPFIVLVFYKDTRGAFVPLQPGDDEAQSAAAGNAAEAEGFGDVIPDDFDETELAVTDEADEDYESFDDDEDLGDYDEDYDEEYEEFDDDEL
ncbi:MAG: hypothetical protein O3B86_16930 [Planctomycetota bacterium]|nr:hypothetical protein [Planctomycetota bacterium]